MPLTRVARSAHVRLPAISAHYLDWPGEGPPVVLLHPNRTNARVWDFVVDHSALGLRFIAPDARGHGLSSYPESGYGYDDYLGDLGALLDALGVRRVHLVGAATGGNLALLWASRHPDAVQSVVVVDPGLSLDPQLSRAVREQMVREFRFPSFGEARARMPFSERWTEEMRDHYGRHALQVLPDGQAQWRYHPPGVVETEHLLETPIWDRIAVRCPLLAVRGVASAVFPAERMRQLCAQVPGARGVEIEADHQLIDPSHQSWTDLSSVITDLVEQYSTRSDT